MPEINRRQLLASSAAAAMTVGGGAALAQDSQNNVSVDANPQLDQQNPDLTKPPSTDSGLLPNLKFSFDTAHTHVTTGGWARQVTIQEMPIAKAMAGVDMHLEPGGIRELHWHSSAEWAYMLAGTARITAVDADGQNFIDDVGVGDLWFFPAGIPHSIQGLKDGCEFLLVFDDGNFSEFDTFQISEWFALTPPDVLAKNFGVPKAAFAQIPQRPATERYMFPGKVPPPLSSDAVRSPFGSVPNTFRYRLSAQKATGYQGGSVKIADSTNFHASTTIAAALVEIRPGGMRELHWHPASDEWQYYISGTGRMTVFAAESTANTFNYQAGDVGYVPTPMGHYIENTGKRPLRFLEILRTNRFTSVSLDQWMALTPPELVRQTLNLDRRTTGVLNKRQPVVVG